MRLRVSAQLAVRDVDVAVTVASGETLALLGPNGAGKSSVLAIVAGLLVPDAGRARLGERELFAVGQPGSERIWLPPHDRRVALLAQEPLLFPHLTVLDNVAFGPRAQGRSRGDSRAIATRWLGEVDAEQWAQRKPSQLSGGQAQRVAVARALATEPDLLLLDEPLAALDVDVATAMRQMLRRVLAQRTAIVVTHDALDTALLASQVAVMDRGVIVEQGETAAVMRRPRSPFAAGLFGLNLIEGVATGPASLRSDAGLVVVGEAEPELVPGESALAVFRPHAVAVHRRHPAGSPRNVFSGVVTALEPIAHHVRVRVGDVRVRVGDVRVRVGEVRGRVGDVRGRVGDVRGRVGELSADITPAAVAELDLAVGVTVHLAVKATEVSLYRE
jgi:molybdate transport system ATP-binding protein